MRPHAPQSRSARRGSWDVDLAGALLDVADAIRPYPEVIGYLQATQDPDFLAQLPRYQGGIQARDAIAGTDRDGDRRGAGIHVAECHRVGGALRVGGDAVHEHPHGIRQRAGFGRRRHRIGSLHETGNVVRKQIRMSFHNRVGSVPSVALH